LEPQIANPVPRWKDRLNALRNTLPIFRMVWEASPRIVVANVSVRLIVSLLPLAMLAVTKVIIDSIYRYTANHTALPTYSGAGGDGIRAGLRFDNSGSGNGLLRHGSG